MGRDLVHLTTTFRSTESHPAPDARAKTGTIDIAGHGMARSRKFRNVAENGQVAFVVDDLASMQPWRPRCVEIRGTGEAIPEPTDSAWEPRLSQTGFDGAIIRIHP